MKFQLLLKCKMVKNKKDFLALKLSDVVFINCLHFNIYEQDNFHALLS